MIILNFPGSDVENIIDPNSEGAICSKDGSVYGAEKTFQTALNVIFHKVLMFYYIGVGGVDSQPN